MTGIGDPDVGAGRHDADALTRRLVSRPSRAAALVALSAIALSAAGASYAAAQAPEGPALPYAPPSPSASASPNPGASASSFPGQAMLDDPGPGDTTQTLIIEADDLRFAPNELSLLAEEPTALRLVGVGQVAHNLIVDELGLQLHVGPGTSSEVLVSDLPPGTYEFYCSIFGHRRAGMFGTLTIE